jgi:2-polyprenyl-3-methyl-5-hydroxy-6-metoxy-1,4-benzoquinol methylase
MDVFKAFDSVVRAERGSFTNDRTLRFTARRDILANAGLTVQAGVNVVHTAVGLVVDDVFNYPGLQAQGEPDEMVEVHFRPTLDVLARIANLSNPTDEVWIGSSLSPFPLATFRPTDLPNNFVTPQFVDKLKSKVGRNHWGIVTAFFRDGLLHVHGWAVPPANFAAGAMPSVYFDGIKVKTVNPAVESWSRSAYWFLGGAVRTGFYAVGECKTQGDYCKIELSFGSADHAAGIRRFPVYQLLTRIEQQPLPLPPVERIHRVSGPGANQHSYINGGKSDFEKFRTLIAEKGRMTSLRGIDVLDWGVGCGRLARHFIHEGAAVTGIDIDADNIAWCRANLKPSTQLVVPLMPPTPLPSNSFDVIISSSVLSHLTEPVMRAWLKELSRLLRPGGVALLSFNGDGNSYLYGSVHPDAIKALDGNGFFDEWRTPDLDGFIEDVEYYRLTLMSSSKAAEIFREHMVLDDIVVGVTSGHQDIAVLRKQAD